MFNLNIAVLNVAVLNVAVLNVAVLNIAILIGNHSVHKNMYVDAFCFSFETNKQHFSIYNIICNLITTHSIM